MVKIATPVPIVWTAVRKPGSPRERCLLLGHNSMGIKGTVLLLKKAGYTASADGEPTTFKGTHSDIENFVDETIRAFGPDLVILEANAGDSGCKTSPFSEAFFNKHKDSRFVLYSGQAELTGEKHLVFSKCKNIHAAVIHKDLPQVLKPLL